MQADAFHRVFAIPELALLIAKYLSLHEISQLMMTRKAFIRQLEPILWRHLNINEIDKPYQVPNTLVRYRQHIQSIQAKGLTNVCKLLEVMAEGLPPLSTSVDGHAGSTSRLEFHRLESLSMNKISGKIENYPVLRLSLVLSHSSNLTQLTIPGVILEQDPLSFESFLFGLAAQVPCLQRFVVKGDELSMATGFPLTEVCLRLSQLIDLELDFSMDKYPSSMNGIHPSLEKILRHLNDINTSNFDSGESTGMRLKSMIPNIERLVLPRKYEDIEEADVDEIKGVIATSCPKLQHLSISYHSDVKYHWVIAGILRGCANSGLRTFHALGFDDCYFDEDEENSFLNELVQYHARTLEEVLLLNSERVKSRSIQSILTTCKNLRTLRVEPRYTYTAPIAISFQDAASNEWVCNHITVLQLCLDREVEVPEGASEEEVIGQTAQKVYAQIGRLVKVEELSLSCNLSGYKRLEEKEFSKDLTLEHGWFAEFAGLKNLRSFKMETDFWSSMGQQEVEFMDTNWPRLEIIEIACNGLKRRVSSKPHWRWLKERRPHLTYIRLRKRN